MKIGIITERFEVPRVASLVSYLKEYAQVNLYVEEELLLDSRDVEFREDIFFTKGSGYVLLAAGRLAEGGGSGRKKIPVVNDASSIRIGIHRFMHNTLCRKAGVNVPDYSFGTLDAVPFKKFITKNIIDQRHLRFLDLLPLVGERGTQVPAVETAEEAGREKFVENFHIYQRFIESRYEYKIYGFGDRLLYYRQIPVLIDPDKMKSREPMMPIPELEIMAKLAMKATGLRVTSMDFLEENGKFYMTDINPNPNFNYVPDGPKILGDFLMELAGGK